VKIEALTGYFQKESAVVLTFLFGSKAKGREGEVSYEAVDWWDFVSDFYRIGQGAKSLPPEEKARVSSSRSSPHSETS